MRLFSTWAASAVLTLALGSTACSGNSDAVDNTPLEPTRDTRISSLSQAVCDQYKTCKGYTPSNAYATEADCKADIERRARDFWSDAHCGHGQINNTRYESCAESAKTLVCRDDLSTAIATFTDCNSDKVCTDPAQ